MSPRLKQISDQNIIELAADLIDARGPAALRLADVAAVSGLAPATLLQRFGSRAALLDRIASALRSRIGALFMAAPAAPLDGLRFCLARLALTAQLDYFLAFPDAAPAYSLELRKHIAFSLAAAVEAGELPPCDVASFARRIQILYFGHFMAARLEGRDFGADDVAAVVEQVLGDLQ